MFRKLNFILLSSRNELFVNFFKYAPSPPYFIPSDAYDVRAKIQMTGLVPFKHLKFYNKIKLFPSISNYLQWEKMLFYYWIFNIQLRYDAIWN